MQSEQIQLRINGIRFNTPKLILPLLKWLITFALTIFLMYYIQHNTIAFPNAGFIAIFFSSIMIWIFRLLPEYIPCLLIILSAILMHIAPRKILLSGFTSNSFFLALSVFIVSALLTKSKLFYRISLHILIRLPSELPVLQKFLFLFGALITPFMSIQSSRVAIMAPLLDNVLYCSKIPPKSDSANSLANAAFNGSILLSNIFLTGKSSNLLILTLLATHNEWQGNWFSWLAAASFTGILFLITFYFLHACQHKHQESIEINRFTLLREVQALGAFTYKEYTAILSLAILFPGACLTTWNIIPGYWICISIGLIALITGTLDLKELKTKINWPFLFYFGAIIGVMRAIQNLGIDSWLIDYCHWLNYLAKLNIAAIIIAIYLISWLGSLLLGTMVAPAVLFTCLIPLTHQSMISGWVLAFVILVASEAWVFPYQSSYYLCFEQLLKQNHNFCLKPILQTNMLFTICKIPIMIASVPFWYIIGAL